MNHRRFSHEEKASPCHTLPKRSTDIHTYYIHVYMFGYGGPHDQSEDLDSSGRWGRGTLFAAVATDRDSAVNRRRYDEADTHQRISQFRTPHSVYMLWTLYHVHTYICMSNIYPSTEPLAVDATRRQMDSVRGRHRGTALTWWGGGPFGLIVDNGLSEQKKRQEVKETYEASQKSHDYNSLD